jgi:hypothetical protein
MRRSRSVVLPDERHPGVIEEVLDVHPAGPVVRLSMMTTP